MDNCMSIAWGHMHTYMCTDGSPKKRFARVDSSSRHSRKRNQIWGEIEVNPHKKGQNPPYEVFVVTMSQKNLQKWVFFVENHRKTRISKIGILIFQKKKNKTSFTRNDADQARQINSTTLRWDDQQSIWRRHPASTFPSSTSSSTPMTTTFGTPTPPFPSGTSRLIHHHHDTPSDQDLWWPTSASPLPLRCERPLPHRLQVATPFWGWVGDGKADETFNPWVVGRRTSTTG